MGKSLLAHALFHRFVSTSAIARNAPCPCGSGRRFKDCHGGLAGPAAAPTTAEELLRLAQVRFALNEPTSALELLERASALAPERADLWRERARVQWTFARTDAEATCRAALALAPTDVVAWNLLGEIILKRDPGGAEAAWREALKIDPHNPEALFHLGNRLRERGEHEVAISHFERALERAPGHPGVLNNLGLAPKPVIGKCWQHSRNTPMRSPTSPISCRGGNATARQCSPTRKRSPSGATFR